MKVQVTITGTMELETGDVRLLEVASAGEVMDTMRYQAKGLTASVERPAKREHKAKAVANEPVTESRED